MVANWMLEALALALLLGVAALATESVFRRWRVASRRIWVAALLGVVALPLAPLPARTVTTFGAGELDPGMTSAARVVSAAMPPPEVTATMLGASRDGTLILIWVLASAGVLVYLVAGRLRLRRLRRGWERAELDGVSLWVSADVGPAVFGVQRREIVVPRWVTRMDDGKRRLTIEHELEHIRGGDAYLWFLGLAVLVALAWNPVIWWMVRRLRTAIEVDCDRRVLRRFGDVGAYGSLLVEMAGRSRSVPLAAAALTSRPTQVERRIREMTRSVGRFRGAITLGGSALAAALVVSACEISRPLTEALGPGAEPNVSSAGAQADPLEVAEIQRTRADAMLEVAVPGGGGSPESPTENRIAAVQPQLESASRLAARGDGSVPALEEPVPGSRAQEQRERAQQFTSSLTPRGRISEAERPAAASAPEPEPTSLSTPPASARLEPADTPGTPSQVPASRDVDETVRISAQPVFTPMEVRPRLRNAAAYERALEQRYPPMLKDAGIGGTVTLWVLIDEAGAVRQTRLYESTGYEQLDRVAESLMREAAEFEPAKNRDQPVPVWVQLAVTFRTR